MEEARFEISTAGLYGQLGYGQRTLWPKDTMADSHNVQVKILEREKWGESRRKDPGSNSRVKYSVQMSKVKNQKETGHTVPLAIVRIGHSVLWP